MVEYTLRDPPPEPLEGGTPRDDAVGGASDAGAELPAGLAVLGGPVESVAVAAMDGRLNRPTRLPRYMNKKLRPRHLAILRLAALGLNNKQIIDRLASRGIHMTPARLSLILRHPDARSVLAAMLGRAADHLDMQDRLKHAAEEALDHLVMTMRETKDDKVRVRAATSLMDRGGYGPTSTVRTPDAVAPVAATSAMHRLSAALEEASRLRATPYEPLRRLAVSSGAVADETPDSQLAPADSDIAGPSQTSEASAA